MLDQPPARATELQASQQSSGLVRLRRLLPVAQILLELLLADQERARGIQPGLQQRPFAQQRLVRDFDHARVAVLTQDQ